MTLQPKTRLGPYEIVSAIGTGGMGVVYKAEDVRLGRYLKCAPWYDPMRSDPFFQELVRNVGLP